MFYYLIVCRYCWICKFIESLILSPPPGNGSDFAFDRGALDNDQLARVERASLLQGRIVVGGSHPGDIPIDGTLTVSGHAYTLIHSTDKAALFTMRNPWGRNPNVDGSADGIINIPNGLDIPLLIDLWRRTRQGGRIWLWGVQILTFRRSSPSECRSCERPPNELMHPGRQGGAFGPEGTASAGNCLPMPFWKEWFVFGNDIYGRTCHCMAYNARFSLAPLCDLCLRNHMRRELLDF